jgi:hypothetical protein
MIAGQHAHVGVAFLLEPLAQSDDGQVVAQRIDLVERGHHRHGPPELLLENRHVVDVQHAVLDLAGDHRGADVGAQTDQLHLIDLEPAGPDELLQRDGARAAH